jgi:hypothetical protein
MATRSIGRRADERRMARRAKFHANVQFRYKGTVGYATINDISCGGIRIDGSNVALPTKGEPVTIFLPVPQNLSRKRRLFTGATATKVASSSSTCPAKQSFCSSST